jgi:hypothetical protein
VNAHPGDLTSTPRERLRAAIAQRTVAEAALAAATQKAGNAQRILDAVQGRLAALGDVEGEIAAHKAAAYRTFAEITTGDDRPVPVLDVPAPLAQRQLAAATERERLAAEHTTAKEALASAADRVLVAAKAVVVAEASRITADLEVATRTAQSLRDDLLAIAGLNAMERGQTWAEGKLRLSPETLRLATQSLDWRPQLPGLESYVSRRAPTWERLLAALQRDADSSSP